MILHWWKGENNLNDSGSSPHSLTWGGIEGSYDTGFIGNAFVVHQGTSWLDAGTVSNVFPDGPWRLTEYLRFPTGTPDGRHDVVLVEGNNEALQVLVYPTTSIAIYPGPMTFNLITPLSLDVFHKLEIAYNGTGTWEVFMDDVSLGTQSHLWVYNTVLTAQQIGAQVYAGPEATWRMDEIQIDDTTVEPTTTVTPTTTTVEPTTTTVEPTTTVAPTTTVEPTTTTVEPTTTTVEPTTTTVEPTTTTVEPTTTTVEPTTTTVEPTTTTVEPTTTTVEPTTTTVEPATTTVEPTTTTVEPTTTTIEPTTTMTPTTTPEPGSPVIMGQTIVPKMYVDAYFTISLANLIVNTQNQYPGGFTLTVSDSKGYDIVTVTTTSVKVKITGDKSITTRNIPVIVNDGTRNSNTYNFVINVIQKAKSTKPSTYNIDITIRKTF